MGQRFSFGRRLCEAALAIALFGLAAACGQQPSPPSPPPALPTSPSVPPPPAQVPPPGTPLVTIGSHTFFLEIADTPEKRTRGLMGRQSLAQDGAMLFIFDQEDLWGLWMKNTLIPLDAVWVSGHGEIVDIQTMFPEPDKSDGELTVYRPRAPARYILEINGGLAGAYGFTAGMAVTLRLGDSSQQLSPR